MIKELILFAVFLGLGSLFRILYKAVTLAENKINSKAVTIIFDLLLAFVGIGSIVAVCFFLNDGIVLPYMIITAVMGFVFVSLFF